MTGQRAAASAVVVAILAATAASARADRPSSAGWYAEGALGGTAFIGDAANYSKTGPALGVRIGYDVFSWLSVGAHVTASTHEATVPPPPEGEFYQLYSTLAEGRVSVPIGPTALFAFGGGGLGIISSNVLDKVGVVAPGEHFTVAFRGGGGLEYQLQNRHYAFGIDGEWTTYPEFDAMSSVTVRTFIRYTY